MGEEPMRSPMGILEDLRASQSISERMGISCVGISWVSHDILWASRGHLMGGRCHVTATALSRHRTVTT